MLNQFGTRAERAQRMSGDQMGKHLPLVDLSGGVMIFQDGSIGIGFRCLPPVCSMLSEDARAALYDGLRSAFRLLPEKATAQVYFGQQSRPSDIAPLLGHGAAETPLVRAAIQSRAHQFIGGMEIARLRSSTLDFFIGLPSVVPPKELEKRVNELNMRMLLDGQSTPPGSFGRLISGYRKALASVNTWANPLHGAVVLSLEEYRDSRAALMHAAEAVNASLMQAGLSPIAMQPEDILRRLFRRNNPQKFESGLDPRGYDSESNIPISEAFLSSTFFWDPSGEEAPRGMVFIDDYYHQVLTLKMPPDPMSFPHLEGIGLFSGLQQMDIVVNITAAPTGPRIKALQDEQTAIENNNKDATSKKKLDEITLELAELGSGEDRLWQAQHIFILRHRNADVLRKAVQTLLSAGQRAKATEIVDEQHAVFQYWIASQPGWSRDQDLNRHNIYSTRQLVAMLPVFGAEGLHPNRKTGAVFETIDGGLYNLNPADSQEFPSPNLLIVGMPGSGKSVATNTVLTQLARHNPRVVIVDIGASYRRYCESVEGTFLEYNVRSNDCRINPFDIYTRRTPDMAEQQGVILHLAKMVAEPRQPDLHSTERAAFEDALTTIARNRNGKPFYMSDFRSTLEGLDSKVAKDLSVRLSPYVSGGSYGNLFDGPTKAPTGNRTTVFELAQLKNTSPELLPVVFQTLIQHVITLSANYPDDLKVLVMDEAHVLLADPVLRSFVEFAYRTFRKLGVIVIGVSQGLSDWIIEGRENAIIGTVSGFIACRQSVGNQDVMSEMLGLSPNERANLAELNVIPGTLAEFMAIRLTAHGRRASRCANRLTPVEYAMFTTDPEDTAVINRWTAPPFGLSLNQSVQKFAQRYPRGVRMAGGPSPEDRPPGQH